LLWKINIYFMNQTEINEYRKALEKEYLDKDIEMETSLSYISIGALGFFITINEKFIKIQIANYKVILILSLLFLFLSFVLILYRKSRTSYYDLKLMNLLDIMKPNSETDNKKMYCLWNQCYHELSFIRILIYICLAAGVGLQILFLFLNLK